MQNNKNQSGNKLIDTKLAEETTGAEFIKNTDSGNSDGMNELLNALLYASPLPIVSMDLESRVTLWNKAAESTFGWLESEVIGKRLPIVPAEKFGEHVELKKRILSGEMFDHEEILRQKKDGTLIPVILYAETIRTGGNKIIGIMNVFIDSTRRKFSYLKYKTMFETMSQGVVYVDPGGNITDANPAAERILGFNKEELFKKSIFDNNFKAIHEDGTPFKSDEYPSVVAFSTGKVVINQIMGLYNYNENNYTWLVVNAVPLIQEGNSMPTLVYATLEDVTERRKATERLRISEQKNAAVLSAIPDVIFMLNREGKCTNFKTDAPKDFPLKSSEFLGKKIDEFLPENRIKIFYDFLNQAFQSGKIQTFIFDFEDGVVVRYMEVRMIKYDREEVLVIVRDITERIVDDRKLEKYKSNLEEQIKERTLSLLETNQRLENEIKKQKQYDKQIRESLIKEKELSDMKSKFISMASHEYKTPLTTIKLFSDLLRMQKNSISDEKYFSYIQKIQNAVDYMTELITDVLSVNKEGKGQMKFNPRKIDIEKICNSIVNEYKLNNGKNHNIHLSLSGQLNNLLADERMIRQMLSNLLSNAVKYSISGSTIFLEVFERENSVMFVIKDEGSGIRKEDFDNLFDAFFRGKNTAAIPGTGLGLTIVKEIVVAHGGTINVESEIGKGSAFTISIPLRAE